jgi:hypothetical protein
MYSSWTPINLFFHYFEDVTHYVVYNNSCWQVIAHVRGVAINLNLPTPPDQVNLSFRGELTMLFINSISVL